MNEATARAMIQAHFDVSNVSAAGGGPGDDIVMFDVSTLYFETDAGDGFREPGFFMDGGWNRRSPSAYDRCDRVSVDGEGVRGQPRRDFRCVAFRSGERVVLQSRQQRSLGL